MVGFFFCKALVYLKHMVTQQAAWREWSETCWNRGVGSAEAGDGEGGSTRRGPESCLAPQKLSPGGWEMQLPTGQIPLGWSARRAGRCSWLLAGSGRHWWKFTLSPAPRSASLGSCPGGWGAGAGALGLAGRRGKPLRRVRPAVLLRSVPACAACPTVAALPFTHQETFGLRGALQSTFCLWLLTCTQGCTGRQKIGQEAGGVLSPSSGGPVRIQPQPRSW